MGEWNDMRESFIFTNGVSLSGLKNERTEIREIKAARKVKGESKKGENQRQEALNTVCKFCPNLRLIPEPYISGTDVQQSN